MGGTVSGQRAGATQENQDMPEGNGFIFFDQVLPIEMCEEVFLNVPAMDLVRSVTRVCKSWHQLLTDRNFWFRKVKREGFHLSAGAEKRLTEEKDVGRALRVLQGVSCRYFPLNFNLIRNPSGRDGLKHWQVQHGGDGLVVECPPVGSNTIPERTGLPTQHCFVSSYTPCTRSQTINLRKVNIEPWIMDILRPEIQVSEWVSARWDCDSKSSLTVMLIGQTEKPTVSKVDWSSRNEDVVNKEWYQMKLDIVDYPAGLSTIHFINKSKDEQFWAGHYGAKTAGSSVILHL